MSDIRRRRLSTTRTAGFTIVELLVAMTIAAILLGVGVPAFQDFVEQRRMTARINDFVLAVNYARSEAANRGGRVTIQALDPSANDNEWGPGYCVIVGNPGNCDGALRTFDALPAGTTLNGVGLFDGVEALGFNSQGMLTAGVPGTIQLCSTDETEDPGRAISLSLIGRASAGQLVCHPPEP